MSVQLKIGGQNYFIDFANIEKVLSSNDTSFKGGMITETNTTVAYDEKNKAVSKEVQTKEFHKSKEVDGFRYNTIQMMIDILLTSEDNESITGDLTKLPISFKLAFNTLIEYGILNVSE